MAASLQGADESPEKQSEAVSKIKTESNVTMSLKKNPPHA
jgi:hypothetical protein